jgi:hypothetical protein
MSTDFVCHGDARMKEIVRGCLLNTVIRGARAGASVIRFGALRRGSLGPLARADIRRDHGDPICACGCAEVWVAPHGWACPHCDSPVPLVRPQRISGTFLSHQ